MTAGNPDQGGGLTETQDLENAEGKCRQGRKLVAAVYLKPAWAEPRAPAALACATARRGSMRS